MQFLFGPVKSRRLGNSLGVNLFCEKQCNLDCLYCEAGKTVHPLCVNEYYVESSSFKEELSSFLKSYEGDLDYITFSGKGEPTLCSNLEEFIQIIRELSSCKIGVITNGVLIGDKKVNEILKLVDMVMPSLDSAIQSTFEQINRPGKRVDVKGVIQNLKLFRESYGGEYFLEMMLLSGINTSPKELKALKMAADDIGAIRLYLNVLDRAPAYTECKPLTEDERALVKEIFNGVNEILL